MPTRVSGPRLRKELKLLDVYAIATGATLSSGLFLLPGLAAAEVGPGLVLAYALAALPMIPATLSMVELATAMPRAGGAYYFVDRSLGPLLGTAGGLGTWLALTLKAALALVGISYYVHAFLPGADGRLVAAGVAVGFGVLNLGGARRSGRFQLALVATLLVILAGFLAVGLPAVEPAHFAGAFAVPFPSLLGATGMLYIGYAGLIKVVSVSEEVENPERNLPLGVFLAFATVLGVYLLAAVVVVGVVPPAVLAGHPTAPAAAAERLLGTAGALPISVGALLAFCSVANAAVMSASRYPWAMSRDRLLPESFGRLTARGAPLLGVLVSVAAIVAFVLVLDAAPLAKLASAVQLVVFALVCGAVLVMRESGLDSYDPGYRAPLYPWLQILGIVAALVLVASMGAGPILGVLAFAALAFVWYRSYAHEHVERHGAIYHVFERLGRRRFDDLDRELRAILKEKGARTADSFEQVIARAEVVDLAAGGFEDAVEEASRRLAARIGVPAERLRTGFLEGTRTGATPVAGGVALPHLRLEEVEDSFLVAIRARGGLLVPAVDPLGAPVPASRIYALFFVVSSQRDASRHLRLLADLATRIDEATFLPAWVACEGAAELRATLLREERTLVLTVDRAGPTAAFVDRALREIQLPEGSLVAVIHRGEETLVPRGRSVLEHGDRLTVIGEPDAIRDLAARYRG